ncbi:unnamed protein product [Cyprideis torosa]|uniref:Trimethylguanosine synthase n=1 Tax=Cyprideis torosa TaxID=163714 RepID=A0A7R8WNP4_9CRUS|nr:unnamed protein product [Cyprideis torosa]CAG0904240.1 unnamed protein product [Cyprideis torosa]
MKPYSGQELVQAARMISDNVALYLPRNVNLQQVLKLAGPGGRVEIEQSILSGKTKAITAYFGSLISFWSRAFGKAKSMSPILGTWKIRGYAAAIQYFLEFTGEPYELKWYFVGPPPDYNKQEWLAEKFSLGLLYPNIPYYIDGDTKLTQSLGIMRYIARKNKLDGSTEEEKQLVDMSELQAQDLRMELVQLFYKNWNEEAKRAFLNPDEKGSLPSYLKLFSSRLQDSKFLVGEHVTHPDFILYESLEWALFAFPDCLDQYSVIQNYHQRLYNLPSMKAFRESSKSVD